MPESPSVQRTFDKFADIYDQSRRQLVPHYDAFYGTVIELMPKDRLAAIRVLDLGAGTGILAAFIAVAYPNATLTLVDISEDMLAHAKRRFRDETSGRIEFVRADYGSMPIAGRFDCIVSALSIHHLEHETKQELFRRCFGAIRPGGQFINADQVLGETPELEAIYREAWLAKVRENGVSDSDLAAAHERMKEDKSAALSQQLDWLRRAGFKDVNCWYKHFSLAVYSGTR